jgi:hypothetical protein
MALTVEMLWLRWSNKASHTITGLLFPPKGPCSPFPRRMRQSNATASGLAGEQLLSTPGSRDDIYNLRASMFEATQDYSTTLFSAKSSVTLPAWVPE